MHFCSVSIAYCRMDRARIKSIDQADSNSYRSIQVLELRQYLGVIMWMCHTIDNRSVFFNSAWRILLILISTWSLPWWDQIIMSMMKVRKSPLHLRYILRIHLPEMSERQIFHRHTHGTRIGILEKFSSTEWEQEITCSQASGKARSMSQGPRKLCPYLRLASCTHRTSYKWKCWRGAADQSGCS